VLAIGCNCSRPMGVGFCERDDRPAGCGRACSPAMACDVGLHCGPGSVCTAECGATVACPAGFSCSVDGTCEAAFDGGPPDARAPREDAPFDANTDTTCAAVRVDAIRTTPNVVLVIDRSGSMNLDFGPGGTRWQVLRDSLLAAPDGLVASLDMVVRFGAVMYSEDPDIAGCPDVSQVPAVIDGYPSVQSLFATNSPAGNTPTGQTLEHVLANIATLAPERADPTVIVLATDGEPATCEDGTDVTTGRMLVVSAAASAYSMGMRTYVVSVGTEIARMHLQEVANAGVGRMAPDPDAPFWVATDTMGLEDALAEIVGGAISCTLELVGEIDPLEACTGTVTLGTDELECGTEWRAVDSTHIEVLGDACARLRRSTDVLFGTFPCGVIIR
jgi:hypothetical protein